MRVAAIQAESAWLDLDAGVDKVCRLIKEAAATGSELIGFPEVFIPGFPHALYTSPPSVEWVLKYQKNSLVLNSPEYNKIRQAVREAGVWVVLGFSERDGSTLYLAQSFIAPSGEVALHRRKLKPTHVERYVFGDGQADSVQSTVKTANGIVIGGLNCWEHMQPLLRYHEYAQGVQVHVASWPPMKWDKEGEPLSPASSAQACGDLVTRMMALEGGTFALCCTAFSTEEGAKIMNLDPNSKESIANFCPIVGGGFTAIYGPNGSIIARAKDEATEQIVTADLDFDDIHRSRPDLLSLNVTSTHASQVCYSDGKHAKTLTERILPLPPTH
ncbi:hypothetical protein JCM6882_007860 [Rhodosporidiobolus microsporus]